MIRFKRANFWQWLFRLLPAVTIVWAALLLKDAVPELQANLPQIRAMWLLLPLAGAVIAGYMSFEIFRLLVAHVRPGAYGRTSLAHLFFVGQLMKHMPGRIWGVAYQSTAGSSIGFVGWASVTVTNMVLATWFAVWMSACVISFYKAISFGICALMVGFLIYWIGWNRRLLMPLLRLMRFLFGRFFLKISDALIPFAASPVRLRLLMLVMYFAYWAVYLTSWLGYGMAFSDITLGNALMLCAMYTLAWAAGFFAFITPSGLGVRELVFVMLAHKYPSDAIAGVVVFGRMMLLVADMVWAAAFGWFSPRCLAGESRR